MDTTIYYILTFKYKVTILHLTNKIVKMKKRDLIIYRVVTALFSLILLAGAITYFVNYDMVSEMFISLGVPTGIIYPLAIAKMLGILAIWLVKNSLIKKLAYLGFALDLIMAIVSHHNAGDDNFFGPVIPLVLLIVSYVFYRRTNIQKINPHSSH